MIIPQELASGPVAGTERQAEGKGRARWGVPSPKPQQSRQPTGCPSHRQFPTGWRGSLPSSAEDAGTCHLLLRGF